MTYSRITDFTIQVIFNMKVFCGRFYGDLSRNSPFEILDYLL